MMTINQNDTNRMNFYKYLITALLFAVNTTALIAQDDAPIVIDPVFEYPIAPDEIEGLTEKSNWLMKHFWDNFDFKTKGTVDQNALNHAFSVYIAPMPYSDVKDVEESVANLIKKIQKNPVLLTQFMKAAEESLYGQRAKMWIDPVYIEFLKAYTSSKKIKDIRKIRYKRQLNILENSLQGNKAPEFKFTKRDGSAGVYRPMSTPTLIEFGNPECDDCRMTRLKLESNAKFSSLVDKGLINVLFIIPDAGEGWENDVAGYSDKWVVGASEEVSDIYDIRLSPSLYVIGKDGKIVAKNVSLDKAISLTIEQTGTDSKSEK